MQFVLRGSSLDMMHTGGRGVIIFSSKIFHKILNTVFRSGIFIFLDTAITNMFLTLDGILTPHLS